MTSPISPASAAKRGQRHHLGPDGPLHDRGRVGQAGDVHPALGGRVLPGQGPGGPGERGQAGSRPKPDTGVVTDGQPGIAAGHVVPDEGRAEQCPRLSGPGIVRHDAIVEADHGRHPQREPLLAAHVRVRRGVAGDGQHMQGPAGTHVRERGHPLVDHHGLRIGGVVQAAGQHPDPVHGQPRARIQAAGGVDVAVRWPVRRLDRHAEQVHGRHGGNLRQPGDRRVVGAPALAGRLRPGLPGHQIQLGGAGPAQQPGIGGAGAPRPRGGHQHHSADQADQQHHAQHGPPAPPQVSAQRQPGRSHGDDSATAGPCSARVLGTPARASQHASRATGSTPTGWPANTSQHPRPRARVGSHSDYAIRKQEADTTA